MTGPKKPTNSREWRDAQVEKSASQVREKQDRLDRWLREGRLRIPDSLFDNIPLSAWDPQLKLAFADGRPYASISPGSAPYWGVSYFDKAKEQSIPFTQNESFRLLCRARLKDGRTIDSMEVLFLPIPINHFSFDRLIPVDELETFEASPLLMPEAIREQMLHLRYPDRSFGETLVATIGAEKFLIQDGLHSLNLCFFQNETRTGAELEKTIGPYKESMGKLPQNEVQDSTCALAAFEGTQLARLKERLRASL